MGCGSVLKHDMAFVNSSLIMSTIKDSLEYIPFLE